MATDVLSPAPLALHDKVDANKVRPKYVTTQLNYWKDPGDGLPPTPLVVGGPKG